MNLEPLHLSEGELVHAAKAILDMNTVVQATVLRLPRTKPWQRHLLAHLKVASRRIQVLRMTIAMEKAPPEISEAAAQVLHSLRAADAYAWTVRVDADTKTAVLVALALAQKVSKTLAA